VPATLSSNAQPTVLCFLQDPLSDEQPGAAAMGADHKESMGRQFSREHGFHKGQNTDGIFPNTAMAKQLGKIMGDEHASKS